MPETKRKASGSPARGLSHDLMEFTGKRISAQQGRAMGRKLQQCEAGDPLVVLFWNQDKLDALDLTFGSAAVQAELAQAGVDDEPDTKSALLAHMHDNGGESIGPEETESSCVFFKEPSAMENCMRSLREDLPYAHVFTPQGAARANVAVEEPVALTLVSYKTERVKPDLAISRFFYI